MYATCAALRLHLSLTRRPQEQKIVDYPSSCYVIGRSGTGKTTTMVDKMLAIQLIHQKMESKPRQVFVTQSKVLATNVEDYFNKRMSSYKRARYSPQELRKSERDVEQEIEYVDQDDNQQWRSGLSERSRFSELQDGNFPLFITYDQVRMPLSSRYLISPFREQLCTMLQNDLVRGDQSGGLIIPRTDILGDEAASPTSPTSPRMSRLHASMSSSDYMQQSRRNFVSYWEFLVSYWDHFPQTLTRALGEERRLMHNLS